ncbi:MAG: hypothetical protein AAGE52_37260, partial [Myxococcota bacterium]
MKPPERKTHLAMAFAVALGVPEGNDEIFAPLEDVAFGSCESVHHERGTPRCALEGDAITLWFREPIDGEMRVDLDGAALPFRSNAVEGGRQIALRVPSAGTLTVYVWSDDERYRWTLSIANPTPNETLAEAQRLRQAGDLDEASALLRYEPADDFERAERDSLRGRIALSKGEGAEAEELLQQAMHNYQTSGHHAHLARDAIALAYVRHQLRFDFSGAEEALAIAQRAARLAAEFRTDVALQAGSLALDAASPADALAHFEDAERWARRLRITDAISFALEMRAKALMRLGRRQEAAALLDSLGTEEESVCAQAHRQSTRAWLAFLDLEAGSTHALRPALADAQAALRHFRGACPRKNSEADAAGTVALLQTALGDPDAAALAIAEAREALPQMAFDLASWIADAEGRVALARGETEAAIRIYEGLRVAASQAVHPEAEWRAAWSLAEAHAGPERIEILERAEALLEAEVESIPMGAGRDTLSSRRHRTAAALVAALVDEGDLHAALLAARRARSRGLRALALRSRVHALDSESRQAWLDALGRYQQGRAALDRSLAERWSLTESSLAILDSRIEAEARTLRRTLDDAYRALGEQPSADLQTPGEDTFLWFAQQVDRGWILFGQRGSEVRALRRLAQPQGNAGSWAFDPFADLLEGAARIALFPTAALSALDLHAAPFRGEPLLAHAEVVYPLDVPTAPSATEGEPLLISDPGSDLPGARREVDALAGGLEHATVLRGEAATRDAVLQALGGASFLHFAGHGSEGTQGWDSTLRLAGETALSPEDVLASPAVPPMVI